MSDHDSSAPMLRTPLYDLHVSLGAKMVPFAGYEMPVQYPAGILKEHTHTGARLGLGHVLLHRAARHELDHHESQQQHAQQGGQHEQDAFEDVGEHGTTSLGLRRMGETRYQRNILIRI